MAEGRVTSGSTPEVADLVALARSRGDGITYASPGVGHVSHLAAELLARVRALQRRQPRYREPVLEVGPYRFDPQSGQLQVRTSDGVVTVPLAGKEEQLMAYFLEHPSFSMGQVLI